MLIATEIEIAASAEGVLSILVDFDSYSDWNPLVYRIQGTPTVDEVVKLYVNLGSQKLKRKHVISRVDSNEALCWTIQTQRPWLMRGERCQTLEVLDANRCVYRNEERVEGLSSLLVSAFFRGKIKAGIEACSLSLKQRAEST